MAAGSSGHLGKNVYHPVICDGILYRNSERVRAQARAHDAGLTKEQAAGATLFHIGRRVGTSSRKMTKQGIRPAGNDVPTPTQPESSSASRSRK